MKRSLYYIPVLFIIYLLASCGTTKNTKARRVYHAINSKYNIYYNGKTSFDDALSTMQKGYKEAYTEMILMYPISAQPKDKTATGGPFDRSIEKGNKAIKMHSIQVKPAKKPGWKSNPKQLAFQEQEEYNPFLKYCWLMVGEGQFYNADFLQASATFSYISRHYATDEHVMAEARIWQARCYSEMGWFYEAEDILGKLNTRGIPKDERSFYAAVYADYLVKNQSFEEAIPYLQTAIKAEKNRRQRTRMKYLLGQLYAGEELNDLAYKAFGEVASSSPPYELEFAARIRQTEVFSSSNTRKVVRMLEGMAKSEKNKDYLDQVYYALGNIYIADRDTAKAIESYEKGVEKGTQNGMDKAVLWIKLGDLYFGMRNYIKAQPCFSGAAGIIKKEYRDYERVSKLSAVLDELVVHAEAIHLQDSLQTLARMPEAERLALIDKKIQEIIKEEEEAKKQAEKDAYLAERDAMGTGIDRPGMGSVMTPTMPAAGGGGFYFYNPQMVSQGKTQFQRKWGRRPLEDDWRRRDKKVSSFDEPSGALQQGVTEGTLPADSLDTALNDSISDNPKTREFYLQQIPFTEDEIDASNLIIIDGMYNIGLVYKDKLDDIPLSIESFEELEKRFPENEHLLECYYQIYLMALRTRDAELAERYRNRMIEAFPKEDYTVAISNPDYEHNIRSMDSVQTALYEATYTAYLEEDTATVYRNYEEISAKYPLATLVPKFMFLKALTYVQRNDAESFKEALKALIEKYPKADVTELAGEMLKGVLRGRELAQGGIKGMIWNMRFGDDGTLSAEDSARTFSAEKNLPSRVIIMYPEEKVDRNKLLFTVALYNFSSFIVKELDLAFDEAGPVRMLTVSGFINFDEAIQYCKMIYGEDGYASKLNDNITIVPISDDNYSTLMRGKTLDEYISFLDENFGEEVASTTARLKARMEAATIEEEIKEMESQPEQQTQDKPESLPTEPTVTIPEEEIPIPLPQPKDTTTIETITPPEVIEETVPSDTTSVDIPVTDTSKLQNVKAEKPKTPEQIRKEKEAEYKKRLAQKAKEQKEKERAYKQKLKERDKNRRAALKAQGKK